MLVETGGLMLTAGRDPTHKTWSELGRAAASYFV